MVCQSLRSTAAWYSVSSAATIAAGSSFAATGASNSAVASASGARNRGGFHWLLTRLMGESSGVRGGGPATAGSPAADRRRRAGRASKMRGMAAVSHRPMRRSISSSMCSMRCPAARAASMTRLLQVVDHRRGHLRRPAATARSMRRGMAPRNPSVMTASASRAAATGNGSEITPSLSRRPSISTLGKIERQRHARAHRVRHTALAQHHGIAGRGIGRDHAQRDRQVFEQRITERALHTRADQPRVAQ